MDTKLIFDVVNLAVVLAILCYVLNLAERVAKIEGLLEGQGLKSGQDAHQA